MFCGKPECEPPKQKEEIEQERWVEMIKNDDAKPYIKATNNEYADVGYLCFEFGYCVLLSGERCMGISEKIVVKEYDVFDMPIMGEDFGERVVMSCLEGGYMIFNIDRRYGHLYWEDWFPAYAPMRLDVYKKPRKPSPEIDCYVGRMHDRKMLFVVGRNVGDMKRGELSAFCKNIIVSDDGKVMTVRVSVKGKDGDDIWSFQRGDFWKMKGVIDMRFIDLKV